jgi:hypothetical protein
LQADIEYLKSRYDSIKNLNNAKFSQIRPKLDSVLKELGFNSLEELDQKINESTSGEALQNWQKVSSTLNKLDKAEGIIYGILGLAALAGVAIVSFGAIFGVFGFFAGLAIVGEILAVLGVLAMIYSAIDGAIQRDKLRSAIRDLCKTRLKARRSIELLEAIGRWASLIEVLFDYFLSTGNKEKDISHLVAAFEPINNTLKQDYDQWTWKYTADQLSSLDKGRDSWVHEDPDVDTIINELRQEESSKAQVNFANIAMENQIVSSVPVVNFS